MAKFKLSLVCLIVALLGACAYMTKATEFPGSDGAGLPDDLVGIFHYRYSSDLDTLGQVSINIDGRDASWFEPGVHNLEIKKHYGFARLKAGIHEVTWKGEYKTKEGWGDWVGTLTFNVEAGRVYRLVVEKYYFRPESPVSIWIIDEKTGDLVSGKPGRWWR